MQTDLSKKVALSWHDADDDVKLFCVEVSDILSHEHKKALSRQRKDSISSTEAEDSSSPNPRVTKTKNAKKKASRSKTLMTSQLVSSTATEELVADQINSSTASFMIDPYSEPLMKRAISDSSVEPTSWSSVGQLSLPLSFYHQVDIDADAIFGMNASGQVDLTDDDIVDMWNALD